MNVGETQFCVHCGEEAEYIYLSTEDGRGLTAAFVHRRALPGAEPHDHKAEPE